MANPYQNIMNYVPSASAGFRPEAAPRVWDTLWGEAVAPNGGEEEEVVVEGVIPEAPEGDLLNLWNDLKTDFVKGKDEATAKAVLNNLYDIESGIWGSPEERRVNNPWVDPDSVVPNTQQFVNQPGSDTPWTNPDYVASDLAANRAATTVSGGDTLQATGLNTPVDDSVVLEQLSINPNTPRVPAYPSQDYGATGANLGLFPTYPGVTPEVIEQTQNNIWESPFVPNPGQWDEQERIDEQLAQNAERIRSEQAARKRDQARATRLEVKRRKDEQAAKELKKQEAQLRTQSMLDDLMSKTAARGRQQGRAFTGPMAGLWT